MLPYKPYMDPMGHIPTSCRNVVRSLESETKGSEVLTQPLEGLVPRGKITVLVVLV